MQSALADTSTATEDVDATASLERVAQAYGGDLLEGSWWQWAEAPREDMRHRCVDALGRLAEPREATGDPEGALGAPGALEQAVCGDRYGEELYRRIFRLQARLGRPDAMRRAARELEGRLAELAVDLDDQTTALLDELLAPRPRAMARR